MAVVSGPAGFGKSELLHSFASQAIAAGAAHVAATALPIEKAVPFGVLAQLFQVAELPNNSAADVIPLVNDNLSAILSQDASSPIAGRIFHRVHQALLELVEHLSADGPLVITIDDIHHADLPSLHSLSAFVRRVRTARLLVVLATPGGNHCLGPSFEAHVPPPPYSVPVVLGPLSPRGTAELLDQELGRSAAPWWAADAHTISGGNPLITRGLVEDNRVAADSDRNFHVGANYGKALMSCLYRSDPVELAVARGIAVLGDAAAERLLSQLVGVDLGATRCALQALGELGAVDGVRFRHPAATVALRNAMTHEERLELHLKAADLLHQHNTPASVVAEHLLAVDHIDRRYALSVLHDAAEHALANREPDRALDFLRLAARHGPDHPASVTTSAILACVELHLDTAAAARRIPALAQAIRDGVLTGRHAGEVGMLQILLGDRAGAQETLRIVAESAEPHGQAAASIVDRLSTWLEVIYPSSTAIAQTGDPEDRQMSAAPLTYHGKQAAQLMSTLLTTGPSSRTTDEAKRLLRASKANTEVEVDVVVALFALVTSDDLTSADQWARRLQADLDSCPSLLWRAAFAAGRAEIALRRGAITEAGRHAEAALSIVPAEHLGVGVGQPLSVLLQVCTLTERYDRASQLLRVPLPSAVFESPLGMGYLLSRGGYHLAVNQPGLALDDFLMVGELATAWGCDLPALFPWRGGAARACIRLGRTEEARSLAAEQLRLCPPHEHRLLAESLRTVAACDPGPQRRELLEQARELLAGIEAPVELARVLADLAEATRAAGQESKARMLDWRSQNIMRGAGATAASGTSEPAAADVVETAEHPAADLLTNSEIRVATLATQGLSNRQISARLFITISTVEQHLTRVYRKLNVKSRAELPADLMVEQLVDAHAS